MGLGVTSATADWAVRFDEVMITRLWGPVTAVPEVAAEDDVPGPATLELRSYPVPFGSSLILPHTVQWSLPRIRTA